MNDSAVIGKLCYGRQTDLTRYTPSYYRINSNVCNLIALAINPLTSTAILINARPSSSYPISAPLDDIRADNCQWHSRRQRSRNVTMYKIRCTDLAQLAFTISRNIRYSKLHVKGREEEREREKEKRESKWEKKELERERGKGREIESQLATKIFCAFRLSFWQKYQCTRKAQYQIAVSLFACDNITKERSRL